MISSEFYIALGGLGLHIESEVPLQCSERLSMFETFETTTDVVVSVGVLNEISDMPAEMIGEDFLMKYYRNGVQRWCVPLSGTRELLARIEYTDKVDTIRVSVNLKDHPKAVRTVDKVLQLLPLRAMLTQRRRLVLHASRVEYGGRAILFTAPSGTGKSTQARLWHDVAGSRILSNDRTLLREAEGQWQSEAYAIDGREAVEGNVTAPLGAIVVLRQSAENRVERLSALKAMKALMEQSMLDIWDLEQLHQAELLWLEILSSTPVYCLHCRPDAEAVHCLKERLIKDGVL